MSLLWGLIRAFVVLGVFMVGMVTGIAVQRVEEVTEDEVECVP